MKLNFTSVKSLLMALLITVSVLSANAQIFTEDFESIGLGQGWTTMQGAAATGAGWGLASLDPTTPAGNFGPECVVSRSWLSGAAIQADNYIISPKIDLSTVVSGPINLTYYWANSPNSWVDDHDVYVMTSAPIDAADIVANGVAINNVTGSGSTVYTKEQVDISTYIGVDSLYIIFHHTSFDNEYITLDDISVAAPADFDLNMIDFTIDDGGFAMFGYIPYFTVPDMNYAIRFANDGIEPINGFSFDGQISDFQGDFNNTYSSILPVADTITVRGAISLAAPIPAQTYTVDITSLIDSTDGLSSNNDLGDEVVVSTSEDWYVRYDTLIFNAMTEIPTAPEVFSDQFFQFIADRFLNITTLLGGPGGEPINKVMYGSAFEFTPEKTNVKTVEVMIAPKATGQETWVEVYNYDNALNTIGDAVEPVFTSDTITVPAGFDDNVPHLMEYDVSGLLTLGKGKYIVCVVEKSNSDADGLGMLAFRNDDAWSENNSSFFNYEYINSADNFPALLGFRNSNVFYVYSSNNLPINSSFPISLRTADVTGIAADLNVNELINVYPNPAQDVFQVTVGGNDFLPTSVTVKDLAGRTVQVVNGTYGKKVITVDASSLESGVYFVELADGSQKATKKIVIE